MDENEIQNPLPNDLEPRLQKIYDTKRKEIQKALEKLVSSYKGIKNYTKKFDKDFLQKIEDQIKKSKGERPFLPETKEEHAAAIQSMLSLDYDPPDQPELVASHLRALWVMNTVRYIYVKPPQLLDGHLDIALYRLMAKVEFLCSEFSRDSKEFKRVTKSTGVKEKKKKDRVDIVLDIYHRMNPQSRCRMSKNSIAEHIKENMVDHPDYKGKKPLSVSTIKRYLEEVGIF